MTKINKIMIIGYRYYNTLYEVYGFNYYTIIYGNK